MLASEILARRSAPDSAVCGAALNEEHLVAEHRPRSCQRGEKDFVANVVAALMTNVRIVYYAQASDALVARQAIGRHAAVTRAPVAGLLRTSGSLSLFFIAGAEATRADFCLWGFLPPPGFLPLQSRLRAFSYLRAAPRAFPFEPCPIASLKRMISWPRLIRS